MSSEWLTPNNSLEQFVGVSLFRKKHFGFFGNQLHYQCIDLAFWTIQFFIVLRCAYRCGFRIEERSGENGSVSLRSQYLHGRLLWHRSTTGIPKARGLVHPTVAWTHRGPGRDHCRITCQYQAMDLLFMYTIRRCRQTDFHQGRHLQNPPLIAPR